MKWIYLTAGGILGTWSRYFLSGTVYQWLGTHFPIGTLIVNLLGCFLIGFFAALSEEKFLLSSNARIFLMAGFCGAFTTFSTYIFESDHLMKDGENLKAFVNLFLSVLGGLIIFRLGVLLGRLLP